MLTRKLAIFFELFDSSYTQVIRQIISWLQFIECSSQGYGGTTWVIMQWQLGWLHKNKGFALCHPPPIFFQPVTSQFLMSHTQADRGLSVPGYLTNKDNGLKEPATQKLSASEFLCLAAVLAEVQTFPKTSSLLCKRGFNAGAAAHILLCKACWGRGPTAQHRPTLTQPSV